MTTSKKKYFRVLDDKPRDGRPPHESTLRRWNRGEYSSTNEGPPPQWIRAWVEGKRKGKFFPRAISGLGRFSTRAKRLFLRLARAKGILSEEIASAKYRLGEQDGVHCCESPEDMWTYLGGTIEGNYIVEFTGEKLEGQTIAEKYGVQVRNVVPLGEPIPAEEFRVKNHLPSPLPPADFIDSAEYE